MQETDAHAGMGPVGVQDYVPDPVTDSGVHALVVGPTLTIKCPQCDGRGWTLRTILELLGDSLAVIPADGGDDLIREFYVRLLKADEGKPAADKLAPLFPSDLIYADEIDHQRDRLWAAVQGLANWYVPGDPDSMNRLNTALDAFGTHHALFWRPEGPPRGATKGEYAAVGALFIGVLRDFHGDDWLPEWEMAWVEAYGYAADQMFARGQRAVTSGEVTMPRYPRGRVDGQ